MTPPGAPTIPGPYSPDFDHSSSPSLHVTTSNPRPPLFLPPTSPSATASLSMSYCSNVQAALDNDVVSRKRVRHNDYNSNSDFTPRQKTPRVKITSPSTQSSATSFSAGESPSGFVNTRYHIVGGLDTPSAARLDAEERHEEDIRGVDYRPNRWALNARQQSASYFPRTPAEAASVRHAVLKRERSSYQRGWGTVVMNMVGGVAGKVFNFCWNSAFRGFQAGEGQAYKMDGNTLAVVEQSTWMNIGEKDNVFHENYEGQHNQSMTPVPGQFPEEGFINDYMSNPSAYRGHQLSTPVSHAAEGVILRGNWVLVHNTDRIHEGNHSPIFPAHQNSPTTQRQRRPISRTLLSTAGNRSRLTASRPSPAGSPGSPVKRPASFASPRASPRRSIAGEVNPFATASDGHRRSKSSIASPRRASEVESKQGFATPTSPDVHRFEKKIRRKERRDDESMQRLNQQLQDMIKEGKAALGTRIEIEEGEEEDDDDEGYEAGNEMMGASKW
jgi:hypothetical protein